VKPFLLLSIRSEAAAVTEEYDAFRRFLGVSKESCRPARWPPGR
jgi:hypothetical protein